MKEKSEIVTYFGVELNDWYVTRIVLGFLLTFHNMCLSIQQWITLVHIYTPVNMARLSNHLLLESTNTFFLNLLNINFKKSF